MTIVKIGTRNYIFTYYESEDWDLNLHLIIGNNYNFIIDPGMGKFNVEPMMTFARELNALPFIIINSHYHWDHTWGNYAVKDQMIIAHSSCASIIQSKWQESLEQNKAYVREPLEMTLPKMTFNEELYFPEDRIRLIHTPGHSPDSISVIDEFDGIINMGDNIGDTCEEIVPNLECDKSVYLESLLKCKSYGAHTLVSGHNRVLESDSIDEIIRLITKG